MRPAYRSELAQRLGATNGPLLLCVAMMREVDKLDSYRLLAAAVTRLAAEAPGRPWRLVVVGDGPARPRVEAALASVPAGRVCFMGALEPPALVPLYVSADILAFPGLGDALGLVYLEAAAAGLPVVACHGPGPDFMVTPDGGVLTDPTPTAFAAALGALLDDPGRRRALGAGARRFVAAERSLDALQRRLAAGLARLGLLARVRPPASPGKSDDNG
jgi:glycosyltransferase involved in cell wall biosynthesis